jgi:hypothetical protein
MCTHWPLPTRNGPVSITVIRAGQDRRYRSPPRPDPAPPEHADQADIGTSVLARLSQSVTVIVVTSQSVMPRLRRSR